MTECDAVSSICMDSDLSRNCSPLMDECSCAVLLWRPLMNTSTQSILEMFSWRDSVTKRWPRKSLDINTGPRESCAALHVWGWALSCWNSCWAGRSTGWSASSQHLSQEQSGQGWEMLQGYSLDTWESRQEVAPPLVRRDADDSGVHTLIFCSETAACRKE